jgi:hypothetical protein
MLTRRVALIDMSETVQFSQLAKVAAAFNLQVQRDLSPIWNVRASVTAVPTLDDLPIGVWPIFIVTNLPPGEGGVHLTQHRQPYALVEIGDGWTVAASHECLEMLVDPSGNHVHPSTAIEVKDNQVVDALGKYEYLVEVCDPSEDEPFAYAIDDVTVSDFYTPHFFDPVMVPGVRYSFTGALKRPREVLKNGYLSWFNPSTRTMQQLRFMGSPEILDLGPADERLSLREFVDNKSRPTVAISRQSKRAPRLAATLKRAEVLASESKKRASLYRIERENKTSD